MHQIFPGVCPFILSCQTPSKAEDTRDRKPTPIFDPVCIQPETDGRTDKETCPSICSSLRWSLTHTKSMLAVEIHHRNTEFHPKSSHNPLPTRSEIRADFRTGPTFYLNFDI